MDDPRYNDPFIRGINTGIYFLMAMPFAMTLAAGGGIWLAVRARRKSEALAAD